MANHIRLLIRESSNAEAFRSSSFLYCVGQQEVIQNFSLISGFCHYSGKLPSGYKSHGSLFPQRTVTILKVIGGTSSEQRSYTLEHRGIGVCGKDCGISTCLHWAKNLIGKISRFLRKGFSVADVSCFLPPSLFHHIQPPPSLPPTRVGSFLLWPAVFDST